MTPRRHSPSPSVSTPQRDADGAASGGLCCVVVEDQTMFLQLLVGMLRTIPGIQLAAVAQGVREAVDTCRNLPVDLLLLDLVLPDGDGLDVLRDVVTRRPDVDCVVLSSAAAEFSCPPSLLPHLRGVVDKTQTYERLATVIEDVARSRGAIPAGEQSASPDPRSVLRPREFEIFQLIGQGLKTLEISRRLGISANTVETHRKNLASTLNASGAELVRMAAIYNQTSLPRSEPR